MVKIVMKRIMVVVGHANRVLLVIRADLTRRQHGSCHHPDAGIKNPVWHNFVFLCEYCKGPAFAEDWLKRHGFFRSKWAIFPIAS